MQIPDCYDPAAQEAANALSYTARVMRLPRCQCCDSPITTEQYLDLEPFGVKALACESCVKTHSRWNDFWEEME